MTFITYIISSIVSAGLALIAQNKGSKIKGEHILISFIIPLLAGYNLYLILVDDKDESSEY